MNNEKKKLQVHNSKIKLELLINNSLIEIANNIKIINNIINKHKNFINFTELIKIYEIYKWVILKEEYINIKKNVTINKKFHIQIIKIYGTVNNYYNIEEQEDKNKIIKKINNDTDLLIIEWDQLKKIHHDILVKNMNNIRNIKIIKINQKDIKYNKLIEELYEIFYKIKENKFKLKTLKTQYKY